MITETRTPIRVRYGETDMMGVVYHANYLLYFEDARCDFLEAIGCPYESIETAGYMCPAYSMEVTYHEPLRFGEGAYVRTRVVSSTSTKAVYAQEVYREGDDPAVDHPLVEARFTGCVVNRATFKPVSIKRALPQLHEKYRALAAEAARASAAVDDGTAGDAGGAAPCNTNAAGRRTDA